jgi:cytidylate kinase
MKERQKSEIKRYNEFYAVNPYDKSNYDLIIDGTDMSIEENADVIVKFIQMKES